MNFFPDNFSKAVIFQGRGEYFIIKGHGELTSCEMNTFYVLFKCDLQTLLYYMHPPCWKLLSWESHVLRGKHAVTRPVNNYY